ncbi:hypothetical protein DAPPUDRAFT_255374 [Daphnia pulex]|uniref:Uncharacterized protein n=1 Tax=Daphnia pulex TaxID=6669 RepID=E9H923_DAPPU|nr:hypothetical protein DAPPUDRAFT_255374 [Daphnia pulex]|eukprot:EFX71713.1 hypothetical protein DAPPUDRAFT_255374 [Daphnia pulex]
MRPSSDNSDTRPSSNNSDTRPSNDNSDTRREDKIVLKSSRILIHISNSK